MRNTKGQFVKGFVSRKGYKHTPEAIEKNRQAHLGKIPWNKGLKGVMKAWNKGISQSEETKEKIRQANIGKKYGEETRNKHRESLLGDKNPRWKGGKQFWQENELKHLSSKYMSWMLDVKKRDNWKCRINNKDCCGRLEAHHILTWKKHPELRYNINNGITLCAFHHPRGKKSENFVEFFQKMIISPTV